MMEKVDEIRKEVELTAPMERVWAAITEAEQVSQWFGDSTEIDLRPGGAARFGWSEYGDVFEAVVTEVDEPRRFSYSWAHHSNQPYDESIAHHVEITLEPTDVGTRLTLVESGFARLPDDEYEKSLRANTSGWDDELRDLREYLSLMAEVG